MSEQLHCRRTLTLPYPKFVSLTQQTEACFAFASHCLLSFAFSFAFIFVYLCFAFCILCSYISLCSLSRKLMRMPKLSRSLTYSPSLSLYVSFSRSHTRSTVGYRGSLALSSRTCPLCPQRQRRTVFTFIVQLIRLLLHLLLLLHTSSSFSHRL